MSGCGEVRSQVVRRVVLLLAPRAGLRHLREGEREVALRVVREWRDSAVDVAGSIHVAVLDGAGEEVPERGDKRDGHLVIPPSWCRPDTQLIIAMSARRSGGIVRTGRIVGEVFAISAEV